MAAGANLDFFAAESNQLSLLNFSFTATDVRVFESYSRPDWELRRLRSVTNWLRCSGSASTPMAMEAPPCSSFGRLQS